MSLIGALNLLYKTAGGAGPAANNLYTWGTNTYGQVGDNTTVTKSTPTLIGTVSDDWVELSVGPTHNLAIGANNQLYAWGDNTKGQLGDGTTINKSSPVLIDSGIWSMVRAGSDYSVAITSLGAMYTWGENSFGELGDGTTVNKSSPVHIGTDSWSIIGAGYSHTVGIKSTGTLWGWGAGSSSQLGDSYTTNQSSPVQITTGSWNSVSAGDNYSLALNSSNSLFAWGVNTYGQRGFLPTSNASSWTLVAGNADFTLAIKLNGTLWAWGNNNSGQLGDSTTISKSSPVQIPGSWSLVKAQLSPSGSGYGTVAGIKTDGSLWAWGNNSTGQLGQSDTISYSSPVQVASDKTWNQVSVNGSFMVAVTSDYATVWTWGSNNLGQLGDNTTISKSSPVQILSAFLGTGNSWTSIGTNATSGFVVQQRTASGDLNGSASTTYAWGGNDSGQLSNNATVNRSSPVALVPPSVGYGYQSIYDTSGKITFFKDYNGFVWGAGDGSTGLLSKAWHSNPTVNRSSPVILSAQSWNSIGLGFSNQTAVGVDSTGTLWAWGVNTTAMGYDYSKTSWPSTWSKIASGSSSIVLLRTDGKLFTSGNGSMGLIGNSSTISRSSPVSLQTVVNQIQSMTPSTYWTDIASANDTAYGVDSGGKVYFWGTTTAGGANGYSSPTVVGSNLDTNNTVMKVCWFAGTNYYNAASNTLYDQTGDFTMEVYIMATGDTVTNSDFYGTTIFGQENNWGYLKFRIDSGDYLGLPTGWYINGDVDSIGQCVIDPTPLGLNEWHHFAIVRRGTGSSNTKLYRDGKVVDTGEYWADATSATTSTIGYRSGAGYFIGYMSNIRISKWAVYDEEFGPRRGILNTGQPDFTSGIYTSLLSWGTGATPLVNNGTAGALTLGGSGGSAGTTLYTPSVPLLRKFRKIDLGAYYQESGTGDNEASGYAITDGKEIYNWGENLYGELAFNTTVARLDTGAALFGNDRGTFISGEDVTANGGTVIVKTTGGKLWAAGDNQYGKLGIGDTISRSSPVQIGTSSWHMVSAGISHVVGIKGDKTLWGWGDNTAFQAGPTSSTPVAVNKGATGTLYGGQAGGAIAWGPNSTGTIGDSTTISKNNPSFISGNKFTLLTQSQPTTALTQTNFGVTDDQDIWAWGNNGASYVLPNGQTISRSSPIVVASPRSGESWTQLIAGQSGGVAITTNGKLYAWGSDYNAQDAATVGALPIRNSWIGVETASGYYAGLRSDGTIWAWGLNAANDIGDYTTIQRSSPVLITTQLDTGNGTGSTRGRAFKSIFTDVKGTNAANRGTVAVATDGSIWAWGNGWTSKYNYTVSPVTTTVNRSSPVQLAAGYDWDKVLLLNTDSIFAQKTDGTVWMWGTAQAPTGYPTNVVNAYDFVSRSSPVQLDSSWNNAKFTASLQSTYLGLKSNGTLWSWGASANGELGDGTTITKSSPVQLAGSWTSIVASALSFKAIKTDGTLWTWGGGAGGVHANYSTTARSSPIQIPGSWSSIYASNSAVTAVRTDGTWYGWGINSSYMMSKTTLDYVTQQKGVLALSNLGFLRGWGSNAYGQVGDNTIVTATLPVVQGNPITDVNWSKIAGKTFYASAAIKTDGTLWTWGYNALGALGLGDVVNRSSPVQVPGSWTMVNITQSGTAIAGTAAIGIKSDGTLWAWGAQPGDGTTIARSSPLQVGTATDWTYCDASGGPGYFAINSSGNAYAWGLGTSGQLGNNAAISRSSPVQISAVAGATFSKVIAPVAAYGPWLIDTAGNSYSTGTNGAWPAVYGGKSSPVAILVGKNITSGYYSAGGGVALDSTGQVWNWATTATGMGDNSTIIKSSPVAIGTTGCLYVGGGTATLSMGYGGAQATAAGVGDYALYRWGQNNPTTATSDSLGINSTIARSSPITIAGGGGSGTWASTSTLSSPVALSTALANPSVTAYTSWSVIKGNISASGTNPGIIALTTDGSLYTWGNYPADNTNITKSSPVLVGSASGIPINNIRGVLPSGWTDKSWTQVALTDRSGYGIDSTGKLWAWGSNRGGLLGQNTSDTAIRSSPTQVGTDTDWAQVYASANANDGATPHVAAVKSNGNVYTWGNDYNGSLGLGVAGVARSSPTQITSLSSVTFMSLGSGMTHAIANGYKLYSFGYNNVGQLGDNSTVSKSDPTLIQGTSSWTQVNAGYQNVLASTINGAIYTWGASTSGMTGIGSGSVSYSSPTLLNSGTGVLYPYNNASSYSSPVQVGTSSWNAVMAGPTYTLGIKVDGTLWGWGTQPTGQLGINSISSTASPVQIGSKTDWQSLAVIGPGAPYSVSPTSIVANPRLNQYAISGAIDSTGALYLWGDNSSGQLADNTIISKSSPILFDSGGTYTYTTPSLPLKLSATSNLSFTQVQAGLAVTAISSNSYIYTWGTNTTGQVGDGTTVTRSSPVLMGGATLIQPVQIGTSSWSQIDAGARHAIGVDINNKLYAWGYNQTGTLGIGGTVDRSSPTQIGAATDWSMTAAGYDTSLAINSGGSVYAWGTNTSYQLGDGTTVTRSSPVQITTGATTGSIGTIAGGVIK